LLTEVAMEDPDAGQDLRRLGAQLLRTNERNEKLIEGLLVLAESDRGLQGKVPVRLDELTATVLDAHSELAGERGVTLRRKLDESLVPGDPVLLERLIANLVSNAIAYNEPGGWVEVVVAAEPALTVRNTGQNVPAEAVPALFEPFRRRGAGLGYCPFHRHRASGHDPRSAAPGGRVDHGDRTAGQAVAALVISRARSRCRAAPVAASRVPSARRGSGAA
jgi:light-regulated signal transduction histidine kinase (bacteriophytochrome)